MYILHTILKESGLLIDLAPFASAWRLSHCIRFNINATHGRVFVWGTG
jgi:hypothetical protein